MTHSALVIRSSSCTSSPLALSLVPSGTPQRISFAGPGTISPPAPLPDVEIPPIPPVGDDPFKPGPMPVRKKRPDVLEEGKHLFNREGRIEVDPIGRSIFVFDSGDKAMRVLENSWRQYLERSTESGKKKIRWRVSGTVMVYEEENYLLITRAVHVLAEEEGF